MYLDNLSNEDKLNMLCHINDLTKDIQVRLIMDSATIVAKALNKGTVVLPDHNCVAKYIDDEYLKTKDSPEARVVCGEYGNIMARINDRTSYFTLEMKRFFNDLMQHMPSQSKELLKAFITYGCIKFNWFKDAANLGRERMLDVIDLFVSILRYKLTGYRLYQLMQTSIRNADEDINFYDENYYLCLLNFFYEFKGNNLNDRAILIYLFFHGLQVDEKDYLPAIKEWLGNDGDAVVSCITNLVEKDIDVMTAIENISQDTCTEAFKSYAYNKYKRYYDDHVKIKIPENADNGITSMEYNKKLFFGDNIIPSDLTVNEFYILLSQITKSYIEEYIDYNTEIYFDIPEEDLMYLAKEYELKKCIVKSESETKTVIQYENNTFVLFTILGDSNIYGLSIFENKATEERDLITFEKDQDARYHMIVGGIE